MSDEIIGLQEWFTTPAGRYLLAWEQDQMDAAVANIFGYHALQLGIPALDGLRANRMPHQWLAMDESIQREAGSAEPVHRIALCTEYVALPFPANSLDLLILPHTLEYSPDPHATLREVERVLVPEGRVVICGLNPLSLWGFRQQRGRIYQRLGCGGLFLPDGGEFIGFWRLQDWLHLLSFEIEQSSFGCYRPSLESSKWLDRYTWMDKVGARWWPILGAAYFMVAVKRVRGMRLLGPAWKAQPARRGKQVSVANRLHRTPPRS